MRPRGLEGWSTNHKNVDRDSIHCLPNGTKFMWYLGLCGTLNRRHSRHTLCARKGESLCAEGPNMYVMSAGLTERTLHNNSLDVLIFLALEHEIVFGTRHFFKKIYVEFQWKVLTVTYLKNFDVLQSLCCPFIELIFHFRHRLLS